MDEWIKIRISAALKRASIRYAQDHDTTLSALIREYLDSLTGDAK